jgi:hypothetical protein
VSTSKGLCSLTAACQKTRVGKCSGAGRLRSMLVLTTSAGSEVKGETAAGGSIADEAFPVR